MKRSSEVRGGVSKDDDITVLEIQWCVYSLYVGVMVYVAFFLVPPNPENPITAAISGSSSSPSSVVSSCPLPRFLRSFLFSLLYSFIFSSCVYVDIHVRGILAILEDNSDRQDTYDTDLQCPMA